MDISKILEYQKLDSELFKIEKSLRDNEDKKNRESDAAKCKDCARALF